MRRAMLLAVVVVLLPTLLHARGTPRPARSIAVTVDGDLEKIVSKGAPDATGYLYRPKSLAAGTKGGLVVMLHGHGGTPKGVILRQAAESMGWFWLSVQGGTELRTPQGIGFQWDTSNVGAVLALTRWVLANRDVDPGKVVLYGFSAGGTMVLETFPKAPKLFAGVITNSSPRTPAKAHEAARIVVFLGTQDPNFAGAAAVRNAFEKRKVGGSLLVLDGAVHNDLAKAPYVCMALRWILRDGTRGNEIRVPKDPPAAPKGELRHICVPWSRAKGAPAGLRRKKSGAKSLARKIQRLLDRGRAWFPHEAQAWSSDAESAPLGGRVTKERLVGFGIDGEKLEKALARLKEGKTAGPLESEHGWHLVVPAAVDEAGR